VSVGYRFGGTTQKGGVEAQVEKAYQKALTSYAQGYLVDAYVQATQVTEVAPWHKGSQGLIKRVQQDLKELEGMARKDEFEGQIEKHYDRGVTHFERDEMVQAKREFEVILTLMPEHGGARGYLAKITERFRNMASNFYEVGMKQFAEGAYQDAKESFQKVLVMDPTHGEAPGMIAKSESLLAEGKAQAAAREKEEKARKLFTAAVRDMEAKRYEEAAKGLEDVVALDPNFGEAKRYRSMVRGILAKQVFDQGMKAMQGGKWSEAIQAFRRAVEMKPDYGEAQNLLEKLMARQGEQRKSESIELYKQGLETLLTGDKEKTRELWQKAADIWPENLDAKRGLERISSGRGPR
jgi:tetratricopeptide (TPR) repeat protein